MMFSSIGHYFLQILDEIELLNVIIQLWITIRGFSMASEWYEKYSGKINLRLAKVGVYEVA